MSTYIEEVTPIILIKEIIDEKRELRKILSKYKVKEPEEIEEMIKKGEIPEHPSYEDFLSALALKKNIEEMRKAISRMIEEI
jgi:F0F1-type ATP synthase delta subunit